MFLQFLLCDHFCCRVIRYQSIIIFNERLSEHLTWEKVLAMVSLSSEFENIMVR
jgi:hypothetical protein